MRDTPARFARAFRFLTSGYGARPEEIAGRALFRDAAGNDIVVVKDIEFYSLCEHHLLPFFGKVHVAYVPDGKVIGLSKVPRIVNAFARRLQVQERLTAEIAAAVEEVLKPQGVWVGIEASHLCMMMRGVEKQGSVTVTSHASGELAADAGRRAWLMALMSGRGA